MEMSGKRFSAVRAISSARLVSVLKRCRNVSTFAFLPIAVLLRAMEENL